MLSLEEFTGLATEIGRKDAKIVNELFISDTYSHKTSGSYNYIPMKNYSSLYTMFKFITEQFGHSGVRFLDVGCGTGRILQLARLFGIENVCGIDLHEPYLIAGRNGFGFSDSQLICKNAFDIDEEFLGKFNVIYTYMPIFYAHKMTELHVHLYNRAKAPSFFVEMLPEYYPMQLFNEYTSYRFIDDKSFTGAIVKKNYGF